MDFGAPVGMEKLFLKQIIHSGERLPSEQKHGKERESERKNEKEKRTCTDTNVTTACK